jgi:hypothetical protein
MAALRRYMLHCELCDNTSLGRCSWLTKREFPVWLVITDNSSKFSKALEMERMYTFVSKGCSTLRLNEIVKVKAKMGSAAIRTRDLSH